MYKHTHSSISSSFTTIEQTQNMPLKRTNVQLDTVSQHTTYIRDIPFLVHFVWSVGTRPLEILSTVHTGVQGLARDPKGRRLPRGVHSRSPARCWNSACSLGGSPAWCLCLVPLPGPTPLAWPARECAGARCLAIIPAMGNWEFGIPGCLGRAAVIGMRAQRQ